MSLRIFTPCLSLLHPRLLAEIAGKPITSYSRPSFQRRLSSKEKPPPIREHRTSQPGDLQKPLQGDHRVLLPAGDQQKPGPNQEQLPHISEEADALAKITGESGPDLDQGTLVQEIQANDQDALKKAPEVLKNEITSSSQTNGTRTYSTSAQVESEAVISFEDEGIEAIGHKFGLPELPLQPNLNLNYRYEPVIKQITNLIMKHGKLSKAQSDMAVVLNHLRTAPPPSVNPARPLIPGSPPPSQLPLNPVLYLQLAIDSVAPLLRIRSQKGAAGGGVALQIPVPLRLRQRRRIALMWILDVISKKRSKGSGREMFGQKIADELIAIVEGRSSVWDRRGTVHKLGVGARANVITRRR